MPTLSTSTSTSFALVPAYDGPPPLPQKYETCPFEKGALVFVLPRTFPGSNKQGGVGTVLGFVKTGDVDSQGNGIQYYLDVKMALGGVDGGVSLKYVNKYVIVEERGRRGRGASGTSTDGNTKDGTVVMTSVPAFNILKERSHSKNNVNTNKVTPPPNNKKKNDGKNKKKVGAKEVGAKEVVKKVAVKEVTQQSPVDDDDDDDDDDDMQIDEEPAVKVTTAKKGAVVKSQTPAMQIDEEPATVKVFAKKETTVKRQSPSPPNSSQTQKLKTDNKKVLESKKKEKETNLIIKKSVTTKPSSSKPVKTPNHKPTSSVPSSLESLGQSTSSIPPPPPQQQALETTIPAHFSNSLQALFRSSDGELPLNFIFHHHKCNNMREEEEKVLGWLREMERRNLVMISDGVVYWI